MVTEDGKDSNEKSSVHRIFTTCLATAAITIFPALINKVYGLMEQNLQLKEAVEKLRLEKNLLQKEFQQLKQLPEIQAQEHYLEELKSELLDRQDIFCNGMTFMDFMDQDELEARMKEKAESPAARALGVTVEDLNRIFLEDTHCGNCREENGKLMWEFYRKWEENLKVKLP